MIIIEDGDLEQQTRIQGKVVGQVGPGPLATPTTAGPSPAFNPYAPSQSHTPFPPSPPPPYIPRQNVKTSLVSTPLRSPARRFSVAFVFALIIYFTVIGTTHTVVNMAGTRIFPDHGAVGIPPVEDGTILRSVGSSDWSSYQSNPRASRFRHSAKTSFNLPITSDELYLISRGSYQNGQIELRQSDSQDGDVKVDITVAYDGDEALRRSTVCLLHRGESGNGIGIYTPTFWNGGIFNSGRLHFEVVVTFPSAGPSGSPLYINKFTTHTGNFHHQGGNLWKTMFFNDIDLRTSNAPIQLQSITALRGSLKSSNGPIEGHFNFSDTLILHTSNSPIRVSAALDSEERVTTLDMQTSNGKIESELYLSTESGSGGNFDVKAHTSNGNIVLRYNESPLEAHLLSRARTSNAEASVQMHPAFEGSFEVRTSNASPSVYDTHPVDPSGAGRRRFVDQNNFRGTVSGSVYWGARDGRRTSSSVMDTSNSRATLTL